MEQGRIDELMIELVGDISYIKSKVEKIDSLERDLNDIKHKQGEDMKDIKSLEERIEKLEGDKTWIIRTIGGILIASILGCILVINKF